MGVCPCGCDEHNAWLRAVCAETDQVDQQGDHHSHSQPHQGGFDHAHHGCQGHAAYVASAPVTASQVVSVCSFVAPAGLLAPPLPLAASVSPLSERAVPLEDAHTLRAQLQVYRI